MPKFELSQKIKGEKQLSVDQIKQFIKDRLSKSCKYKVTSDAPNTLAIKGKVVQGVFTRVTNFKAVFDIKVEGQNSRILVNGETSGNWVFWLFILLGVFSLGFLWLATIVLYLMQRKQPKEVCDSILKSLDSEFGGI